MSTIAVVVIDDCPFVVGLENQVLVIVDVVAAAAAAAAAAAVAVRLYAYCYHCCCCSVQFVRYERFHHFSVRCVQQRYGH